METKRFSQSVIQGENKMPKRPNPLQAPEFNLEKTLQSTLDSENLIRSLIDSGEHNEIVHDTIRRNVEHIKIILGREQVATSASQLLVGFQEAVTLGETFIAQ